MKLWDLDGYTWWAAPTLLLAQREYQSATGVSDDEAQDEKYPPREVTRTEMETLTFMDEDGTRRTFAEQWDREMEAGRLESPQHIPFACTEF